ncbi:MAG: 50S ribosomal protein L18 [Chloroflexi bacterium]|nr:50S ribosomal protein L18 [Chloroflexota bacterium]MCH8868819.1 50S ribosomal protein L18 [Chloroflexota bacterium]MCI0770368.1 50S ribosomal protein L18 [Chloroflexota bacterium]MCI0790241.1 50S ribosomal protein L18 [Chloroflexota bacterium]MCI0795402.1 50S ribosomal protein L18 [Chloroflexota bacterium]
MARIRTNKARRVMRHIRVRRKVKGTTERPRLAIYRSLNHIYAQVIDDTSGVTVAAASSLESDIKGKSGVKAKSEIASQVGTLISERAKNKGINTVVFDRAGYRFHGRLKALAEAARKGGLVF